MIEYISVDEIHVPAKIKSAVWCFLKILSILHISNFKFDLQKVVNLCETDKLFMADPAYTSAVADIEKTVNGRGSARLWLIASYCKQQYCTSLQNSFPDDPRTLHMYLLPRLKGAVWPELTVVSAKPDKARGAKNNPTPHICCLLLSWPGFQFCSRLEPPR